MEMWKSVVGYEGLYEVSDLGNVRSVNRYDSMNRLHEGKELYKDKTKNGYHQVNLWRKNKGSKHYIHRLVLSAFRGEQDETDASHIDGNRTNNKLNNLVWESRSLNLRRMRSHGQAILTSEQVEYIKASRGLVKQVDLASEFGVSQALISKLQLRN